MTLPLVHRIHFPGEAWSKLLVKGYLEFLRIHSEEVQVLLFDASGIHAIFSVEELHNVATSSSHCAIIPASECWLD